MAGSLLLSAAATASASAQTAPAPRGLTSCQSTISKNDMWRKLGPTYVELMSVSGVSCGTGESEVTAYYKCGVKNGGARGTCKSKVNGYTCKDEREVGSDQYIAKVTCTKSRDEIQFTYSENF